MNLRELTSVLRESAGEEEGVDLDGDILDTPFEQLGYDSLALFNTVGRIERENGISLPDDVVTEATTPRFLLDRVNEALAVAESA
ncbi:acyl carrier protein [Amycolatopsis sp. NPDC089917]|uniref:acyl carrier protein n=1 Tax=Amycolatopsis sp. NPDC089917 TaxID=3155187 RepID=UPI00343B5C7D